MLTPEEIKKLNTAGIGKTSTSSSLLDKIGIITTPKESEIDKMFPQFKNQTIETAPKEKAVFENKIGEDEYVMNEFKSGRATVQKNPVTGKTEYTSPDIEAFKSAPDWARDEMLKEQTGKTPLMKALKSEPISRLTGGLLDVTSDLPIKGIAAVEAIGKQTYDEAYNKLIEAKNDPTNSGFKKFMYAAQDSIPQMLIGLGLNFVPGVGKVLSTGYWTGLSLEQQRQETEGELGTATLGNVAIDVVGDRLLGTMLENTLKTPAKMLRNKLWTVLKGASVEGGTEVLQTFLRNANSYQMARTKEEKDTILANTKDYVTSGNMAIEFGVGALGGGIAGAGALAAGTQMPPEIGFQTQEEEIEPEKKETIKDKIVGLGEKISQTDWAKEQRQKSIDSLAEDYSRWVGETVPGKKAIANVERKTAALNLAGTEGRTPQRVLAEYGVIPQTLGTKFDTITQAQTFREAALPFVEAEQQALEEIRWSTPPISVDELVNKTVAKINASKETAGDKKAMIKEAVSEYQAIKDTYGDVVDIIDVQKEKQRYFKSVPFEQTTLKPFKRTVNYSIASAMQKTIEETARNAGYKDVAQLNREIGDIMAAAAFLERMSGQSLKYGKIGKYMFMGVGAALGRTTVGKIFGALGGEMMAHLLMQADVAGPVKRLVLANMQKTNPQAYEDTLAWIKKQGLEKELRLLLPAPSYIPMGAETKADTSGVRIVEPNKSVIRNPKTGKFERAYGESQSQPKNLEIKTATKNAKTVSNISDNNIIDKEKSIDEKIAEYIKNITPGLSIKDVSKGPYKDVGDLSTKILSKLEGRKTVSKQFIMDLTNSGDVKQVERDLIREVLNGMDDTIDVNEFAERVKAELLPLKINNPVIKGGIYENVTLPKETRGNIAKYFEHIFESPIETSAGNVHFGEEMTENYFGHTRIEDMAGNTKDKKGNITGVNKVRRIIEVQSDLYQKGRLQSDMDSYLRDWRKYLSAGDEIKLKEALRTVGKDNTPEQAQKDYKIIGELEEKGKEIARKKLKPKYAKLEQYNDPTAHFRMVREEIKQAAKDGKTKLQFPTGKTAMLIEGLGRNTNFMQFENGRMGDFADPNNLRVGQTLVAGDALRGGQRMATQPWIVTAVLGDGKFKAIPKSAYRGAYSDNTFQQMLDDARSEKPAYDSIDLRREEQFDISGDVDTSNPIYTFYEKTLGRYLVNNFGAKQVTDNKGVKWFEVDIKPEMAKKPVMAFGKSNTQGMIAGSALSAGLMALLYAFDMPEEPEKEKEEEPKDAEVTMYNPVKSQTDKTPTIMASGKKIYDGAIATSDYRMKLGTLVKFDGEDKIYIVEDRMNRRYDPRVYGKTVFDILNTDATKAGLNTAKQFGRQARKYTVVGHDGRKETKEEK